MSTPDLGDGSPQHSVKSVGKFIAVGGGRGGVGKSLVAINLAVYFAQLGKAVVLVDADAGGSNLHSHFGLVAARAEPDVREGGSVAVRGSLAPTSVPGLWLLPAAHDTVAPVLPLRGARKSRWLAALRALPADYLVVDVGPGHGDLALDLMLSADIPIAVTVPEPPAIETTYRFVRAAFRRRLKRALVHDKLRSSILDRVLADIGFLPPPIDLVQKLAKTDKTLADLAWAEAQAMRVQLVVNQTRVRTDTELGAWMSGLVSRHYGVALDELGHVEHDDTVWLTVRRNKPLLIDSPASKSARNIERIARRVVALAAAKADRAPWPGIPMEEPTLYSVIGVTRSASDEEIRRAYKRQREIYATGGLATVSLLDGPQLAAAQRKLDEGYDTLLDLVRRRAYDLSTFPEAEPVVLSARTSRPALAAEQVMLKEELEREIGPETEFTGMLLRKVRESQGLELAEISAKTKIGRAHLQALEDERFEDLPALVYTRGFLVELAKQLRIDPSHVQKTYLRRMREEMAARGKEFRVSAGAPVRRDPVFGALLFVVALVPRAAVALAWAGEPVWDGHYYDFGARRIAAGLGYSDDRDVAGTLVWHPWCHYPVGYSAFLALFYRVLGASHAVAAIANALTGAALAVVTWALARHALSTWRARAAGILVALHPGLILYAALVMTEPLAALLTLVAFWLAVRDRWPARGVALGAIVLGVAALVRPQALLCAPLLACVATKSRDESAPRPGAHPRWVALRRPVLTALGASALALLPVLPWTARNCRVMDGCALVSTNAGWNLAIGAFPRATGRFETLRSSDGCRDVTGQVQQDRCWLHYGLVEIADRPGRWISLIPAKLGFTFDHESFAVQYLHEARPDAWPDATRERARELTTLAHRALLAAAALGAIAFPLMRSARGAKTQGALLAVAATLGAIGVTRAAPIFWPLAVFAAIVPWMPFPGRPGNSPAISLCVTLLATTLITHAVFFGEDRYHVVVTPVLALLAAAAFRRPAELARAVAK